MNTGGPNTLPRKNWRIRPESIPLISVRSNAAKKNLTISSLSKILDALHVSFQDFFRGISPDSDPFVAELCMEIIARQNPQKQSEILQLLRDLDSILSN